MPLSVGEKLGHYEVFSLLGQGGMGEVYRARDTKLKRDVALKVLPDAFARDPERMARFQREAEVLAALNHTNIASIYGVEDRAIIMELIEGPTLADRIRSGAIPLEESFKIAAQIADALEAAHERGIVHRDLKPANVKVREDGTVKVLDFGLATAVQSGAREPGEGANSPTLTMGATEMGVILGTAAYMSPEQAAGKPVDRRADIWSFGVVLWEMLTGKRLFEGETVSHTLADVLRAPIDFEKLPKETPTAIRELLRRCLDRDIKTRLRDIGEARIAIQKWLAQPTKDTEVAVAPIKSRVGWLGWAAAAVAILIAAALGLGWWRAISPVYHPLMRLSVDLGPEALAGGNITTAISPDGARIAFPVRGASGRQLLATRLLNQSTATPLTGTEGGFDPFFSPDGEWIGFFADGKLKKISVQGGAAFTLCDAPNPRGASWGEDSNIIVAPTITSGLSGVPSAGGTPQPLTQLKPGELTHRWPQVLPGGKTLVFNSAIRPAFEDATIEALSLQTGERKTLWRGGYFPRYLPATGSTGYLTYIHQSTLFALPFDPVRLQVRGTPVPLLEDVAGQSASGGGQFDFSRNGTLVYLSGPAVAATYPVVWLESTGKMPPLLSKAGEYFTPRLSPDGQRLALALQGSSGDDIWVYDLPRDSMTRLTFTSGVNRFPVWSPDGKHIAFLSASPGKSSINWVRADGGGTVEKLLDKPGATPWSFSPDSRRLAYYERSPQTGNDLWTLPLDPSDPEHPKPGKPEVFLRSNFNEFNPAFSTDGRWIAYVSDESGMFEIYVRPFPGPGGKWQISTAGGFYPVWSRNGRELFYETPEPDGRIMVTEYTTKADSFLAGKPRLWSDKQILNTNSVNLDLAPEGKRFAVFPIPSAAGESKADVHVTFLLNFFDELRRKVKVAK